MNHILFPTDFSEASEKAFEIALKISVYLKAELVVFHTFHVQLLEPETPASMISDMEKIQEEMALKKFKEFINKNSSLVTYIRDHDIVVKPVITMGLAVDQIKYYTEKNAPLLTIIGKRGLGRSSEIFGSITNSLMNSYEHPLLVVPKNLQDDHLNRVAYATDFDDEDVQSIKEILSYTDKLRTKLHVIHVDDDDDDDDEQMKAFADKFHGTSSFERINFFKIESDDIEEGIDMFVSDNDIGILCVLTQKRNVFQRLFHHSVTKHLASNQGRALLVLFRKDD